MLRALVILLVLGNLGFLAYTQGWLDELLGPSPEATQHEPQRLARQINPERVRVLGPKAAASAAAAEAAGSAASAPNGAASSP